MSVESFRRHSLTLASGPDASGRASEWARGLAAEAGLPEDRTYALDLCIVELVTNIVDHGYRGNPGEIRLDLDLAPTAAVLTLLDRAPAFDPLSVPPPVKPKSVEEAQVGGLGVHLVRSTADRCRYERSDDRNVFTTYFGAAARENA